MKVSIIPSFYTMLYVKNKEGRDNMAENGYSNLLGYINCCRLLRDSLALWGYKCTVLTNEPELLTTLDSSLNVEKAEFSLNVPKDIKFYAAHFKIDAFKHLSLYGDEYSILLDNDIVCLTRLPKNLDLIFDLGIPVYYDITSQSYPAYGRDTIISDKSVVMQEASIGNWAGGEILGGSPAFFSNIYGNCMEYWSNYVTNYISFHHQSDEMLVSCAIEKYILTGNTIFDLGAFGGIHRHWSGKTLHTAIPFKGSLVNSLLHLPGDKEYLSTYKKFDSTFIRKYRFYLRTIVIRKTLSKLKRQISKLFRTKS